MIAIVDYGAANLLSITRALEACGASVTVTSEPEVIAAAAGVVLPGVGAAGAAMERLRARGMDAALRDVAASGRPLLGLCLGMQLFFDQLAEDGETGLGVLAGAVPVLPPGRKIPHMGWNTVEWTPDVPGTELFSSLTPGAYGYFVHSYHCVPADRAQAVAWTEYEGQPICAGVAASNVYGLQFHPEKSGAVGIRMLQNWLALVGTGAPRREQEGSVCQA
jgi:imidazole glycerol-phosphate synthase subunit HisH